MREARRPAHTVSARFITGTFTGDGNVVFGDEISIEIEDNLLKRHRKMHYNDALLLVEADVYAQHAVRSFSDTINFQTSTLIQLVGRIELSNTYVLQAGIATLQTGFGEGGFGQLGFDGSIELDG